MPVSPGGAKQAEALNVYIRKPLSRMGAMRHFHRRRPMLRSCEAFPAAPIISSHSFCYSFFYAVLVVDFLIPFQHFAGIGVDFELHFSGIRLDFPS